MSDCMLIVFNDAHVSNCTFETRSPARGINKLLPSFYELLLLMHLLMPNVKSHIITTNTLTINYTNEHAHVIFYAIIYA